MIYLEAFAKVNLALDVLFKRNDGYHQVEMIMQSVSLADKVILSAREAGIEVSTNIPALCCAEGNIAYKAAALLKSAFRVDKGIHIELEKNIPMAAGLAGGSADAAAVLKGLNKLWELGLDQTGLEILGAKLGSDVPFCLRQGTALATGRGELLQSLPGLPKCFFVLAKLPAAVSTGCVYGQFKPAVCNSRPDIAGMIKSLENQDLGKITECMGNVLETVTTDAFPEISLLKQFMLQNGAIASLMSGSGPTVFGVIPDILSAQLLAEKLRHTTDVQVFIANSQE